MSSRTSLSGVEGEHPLGGVTKKARERIWDNFPKCR
jgi:hypothetical protein